MARIVWKPGKLVNLKLRDDLYSIGQMEEHSIMRFFDIYNHDGVWEHIDLNEIKELFRVFVVGDVNRVLGVGRIKASSVVASQKPLSMYWIRFYNRLDYGHYKGDTDSFPFLGGKLIRTRNVQEAPTHAEVIKHDLSVVEDKAIIEKYELTNMWGDKDLGDRLRRYFDTGIDRDDLKFEVFPGLWNDREKLRPLTRRLPIPMR
ncbi:hypothetical protein I5683_19130 [Citrobacter freundii]|nr:hypothetical protein [Citrobacter freundii]